ncbi:MAG TPA: MBL fold metallo-hydrolase [Verrucomicrobia bacterium]|nr:MBL fold metallo-hydrolase [Verrucomicrobiota bacterium]
MNECVRITVLVENSVHRPGLMAEHGLSFHVQIGRHNILFDTGQTELVVRNAKALGLDLSQLEAIVLSHGHYDHTGGVPAILGIAPKARVEKAMGSNLNS